MQIIASLAVVATVASTAQALGKAIIYNKCSFDTYVWPTDTERSPTTPITIPKGGSFSEGYHTPASGGVSLKISKTTSCTKITQLEYTVQPYSGTNFVWYDGSNVDCTGTDCPFQPEGMFLTTSKGTACPQRVCTPGAATCTGFYTLWNDDVNSLSCDDSADTILYLCATSDNDTSAVASASAAVSSVVAPVLKAPASSSTPTPTSTTTSTTTPAPSSTSSSSAQLNEAPVTTLITVTKGWRHKPSKRAELHGHARRHQH